MWASKFEDLKEDSMKPPVSVNFEVGAKAEIKAEIPKESAGNLLNSLVDLIRPWSEARGLRGDMIRLQREEVLIEIARRARARVEMLESPTEPIPNKFLIPFLEKASNENPDDDIMIEMWSSLLAGAAVDRNARQNRFVSILEEINGAQAGLLTDIIKVGSGPGLLKKGMIHDHIYYVNEAGIRNELADLGEGNDDVEAFGEKILSLLNAPGIAVDVVQVTNDDTNDAWDFRTQDGLYSDKKILDFEILESLFLLKKVELKDLKIPLKDGKKAAIAAFYYVVTYLALELFAKCNPEWFLPEGVDQ